MFSWGILLATVAFSPPNQEAKPDPFFPKILVEAKVTRVVYLGYPDEVWQKVTFEITKVYTGDTKLKGKSFESHFLIDMRVPGVSVLQPPIKEGEIGLWDLTYDDDKKLTSDFMHYGWKTFARALAQPTPARKIIGEIFHGAVFNLPYDSALEWANVVESIYKAAPDERPKLLRRHIYSKNLYVAAWSALLLAEYAPAGLVSYFEKIVNDPELSVSAQVVIDELLTKRDRKNWIASKTRAALFQHWVGGEIVKTNEIIIISDHFNHALHNGSLDWDTWLPLMEKWMIHQLLSPNFEEEIYRFHRPNDARSGVTHNRIVRRAFELLKSSKDQNTQIYAAKWLEYVTLTDKELAVVKEFKDKTKDSHIRSLLDSAIRRSTPTENGNGTEKTNPKGAKEKEVDSQKKRGQDPNP